MHKFKSYLLGMLAAASMAAFTGCAKDEKPPVPTIVVTGPQAAGGNITEGDSINLIVIITDNGASQIDRFEVRYAADNGPEQVLPDESVSGINAASFTYHLATVAGNHSNERYTFTGINKDGVSISKSVRFTITPPVAPQTYTVTLGNQFSGTGSSFASSTGAVYTLADAKANSSLIDWLHYHSAPLTGTLAGNEATLVAPSHAHADSAFSGPDSVSTWATRNDTRFKTGFSLADFDNAATASALEAAFGDATATEAGMVTNLAVGSVFGFKTVAGKYGLVHVTSIEAPAPVSGAGAITLDVKVQP